MEVPRLGVESELQPPVYTAATATWDPSHVCDLYHSSRQHQILNPLSKGRDQTLVLMDASQIRFWGTWELPFSLLNISFRFTMEWLNMWIQFHVHSWMIFCWTWNSRLASLCFQHIKCCAISFWLARFLIRNLLYLNHYPLIGFSLSAFKIFLCL